MLSLRQLARVVCAAVALACVSQVLGCACTTPYDRTSPEQTIASFHRAFRCDDADAEYRCLSGRLKTAFGTLGGYTIARAYLREKEPLAVRFISSADLDGRVRIVPLPGGARVRATIDIGGDQALEVELVNEPEYIVRHEDGRTTHGYAQSVTIEPRKDGIRVDVTDPDLELNSTKPAQTIDLQQHWVIDAFPGLETARTVTQHGRT